VSSQGDDLSLLGGFLSETTRKVRRVLLALDALAIAVRAFGVQVQDVTLLGTTIHIAEDRWLPLGLLVLIGYFAVVFAVYAFSDMHRHSEAITRMARRLPLSPAAFLKYRSSRTAALLLLARALLDMFLPLLLAGVAVFMLRPMR
jgi:hypothetical protein